MLTPTLLASPLFENTSCNALPPEGALRLRTGEAGSAAPAGTETPRSPLGSSMDI